MKTKTKTAIGMAWALTVELFAFALYVIAMCESWRNDYSRSTFTLLLAIGMWIITADGRRVAFKRWKELRRCWR